MSGSGQRDSVGQASTASTVPAPRPSADDPATVDFHARMTPGEAEALDAVIARWAEDMRALGIPVGSDRTSWFRVLVRGEAEAEVESDAELSGQAVDDLQERIGPAKRDAIDARVTVRQPGLAKCAGASPHLACLAGDDGCLPLPRRARTSRRGAHPQPHGSGSPRGR